MDREIRKCLHMLYATLAKVWQQGFFLLQWSHYWRLCRQEVNLHRLALFYLAQMKCLSKPEPNQVSRTSTAAVINRTYIKTWNNLTWRGFGDACSVKIGNQHCYKCEQCIMPNAQFLYFMLQFFLAAFMTGRKISCEHQTSSLLH